MVSMTFAPFAADLHKVLCGSLLPALAPRGTLDQVIAKTAAQWWQPVISPFLTIIGTLVGAVAVLCLAWGARAYVRNFDWHDDQSLWRSAEAVSPGSYKAASMLANMDAAL